MAFSTTYTTRLLNTAGLATALLIPLNEHGGTTAGDLAASPSNGTYVNSPTLTNFGDEYFDRNTRCFSADGVTTYATVPTTKITLSALAGNWTINCWIRYNGTAGVSPSQNQCINGCSSVADGSGNRFNIILKGGASFDNTPNKICFRWSTSADSAAACEYITQQAQIDGDWHLLTVLHTTAAGGTISIGLDGTFGTAVTGADAAMPTAMQANLGLGVILTAGSANASYQSPFDFAEFSFHTAALSIAQMFYLGGAMNGAPPTSAVLEFSPAARLLGMYSRSQLINCVGAYDSNGLRSYDPDAGGGTYVGGYDQGYWYTQSLILRAVSKRSLAGLWLGVNQPTSGSVAFLGCFTSLMLGYDPVGGANPPPAFVASGGPNLAIWNYPTEGGDNPYGTVPNPAGQGTGFKCDALWVKTDSTLTTANSQTSFDTTSPYWPLSPTGSFTVTIDYAHHNIAASGARGTFYPNVKIGATVIGGTILTTVTGVDNWTLKSLAVGTAMNGTTGTLSLATAGNVATGPLAVANVHLQDDSQTVGFELGCFWQWGGMSAFEVAGSLADGQVTVAMLQAYFTKLTRRAVALGQTPTLLLQLVFGQNDLNRTGNAAWSYSAGSWTQSGQAVSSSRQGYQTNLTSIIGVLLDVWISLGYSAARFFVQFGPYHIIAPDPGNWKMQMCYARSEREICFQSLPNQAYRFEGSNIATSAVLDAAVTNGTPNGYSTDTTRTHLSRGGYEIMAASAGNAWTKDTDDFLAGNGRARTWRGRSWR